MSCAALRSELLAAREARQQLLAEFLPAGRGALVALALNLPGADKAPPGASGLADFARQGLQGLLPKVRCLHRGEDALGPFALFRTTLEARWAKGLAVGLEESVPAARLLDLDVYTPDGRQFDRAQLALPPRPCLICALPAVECMRCRRHSPAALERAVHALLSPFRT